MYVLWILLGEIFLTLHLTLTFTLSHFLSDYNQIQSHIGMWNIHNKTEGWTESKVPIHLI